MKDRILQLMKMENMSQQDFARELEISPATLSNIFNGKTNPTNNHILAIHKRFPNININWVLFGEDGMYKDGADDVNEDKAAPNDDIYNKVESGATSTETSIAGDLQPVSYGVRIDSKDGNESQESPVSIVREVVKYIDKPQRKITEIRVFFDDGTFEVFSK